MGASDANGNGRPRKPRSDNYIHFRVTADLRRDLDKIVDDLNAKGLPATRSAVARTMLQTALGNDATSAEVAEILTTVYHVVQQAMGRLVNDAKDNIEDYLEDGLRKFYEDRPRRGPRTAPPP